MLEESPSAFLTDYQEAASLPLQYFGDRASDEPDNFIIGIFVEQKLVGSAGGMRERELKRQHIASIVGVYVHPTHRGTGLSRHLVTAVLARLERLPDIEQVQLTVTAGNEPALRLYQSIGFEVYGREPASLKTGGINYDELLLSRPCS